MSQALPLKPSDNQRQPPDKRQREEESSARLYTPPSRCNYGTHGLATPTPPTTTTTTLCLVGSFQCALEYTVHCQHASLQLRTAAPVRPLIPNRAGDSDAWLSRRIKVIQSEPPSLPPPPPLPAPPCLTPLLPSPNPSIVSRAVRRPSGPSASAPQTCLFLSQQ